MVFEQIPEINEAPSVRISGEEHFRERDSVCKGYEWEKFSLGPRTAGGQCDWNRMTGQIAGSEVKGMRVKVILVLEGHCRDFGYYIE